MLREFYINKDIFPPYSKALTSSHDQSVAMLILGRHYNDDARTTAQLGYQIHL